MPTLLMRIQPAAKRYADVFADMLKVVISVLDENMDRVAGSNQHMTRQAQEQRNVAYENGVMALAMRSGQTQVVERPREEAVCLACDARENCIEKYNISVPVFVDGHVCGGVAAIAMTERQKRRMQKNRDVYVEALQQLAELLTLRAREEFSSRTAGEFLSFLEMCSDVPSAALMGFSAKGEVTFLNAAAQEILSVDAAELPLQAGLKKEESGFWHLRLAGLDYELRGRLFRLNMDECAELFLFERIIRGASPKRRNERLLGKSPAMQALREAVARYGQVDAPVLITGEYGTEKSAIARVIHEESTRQLQPFVVFNCRGLDEQAEAALFGIAAGDGQKGRQGCLERAGHGTICLEQVDCLPQKLQLRLLRLLETGEFYRCGASAPTAFHARLIATSGHDLESLVTNGEFFAPLWYRLNVLPLESVPLREARGDVPLLAKQCLFAAARRQRRRIRRIEPEFFAAVEHEDWPGNIAQLKAAMERAVSLMDADGVIRRDMLFAKTKQMPATAAAVRSIGDAEREVIASALRRWGNDSRGKRAAAQELGIGLATLYRKIKRYDL